VRERRRKASFRKASFKMWSYKGINIRWLGHDSFELEGSKTKVLVDPFKISRPVTADILLITHEHFDHLSADDIRKVSSSSRTQVVAAKPCESELSKLNVRANYVSPGSHLELLGVKIDALPAYNLNKFREPGHVFHPKEDGRVGYVITLDGVRIYHAGDTDAIPEMRGLSVDVALLPVSGTYVMTPEEAASAANGMNAKIAIPMHYGAIVGSKADAEKFKSLVVKTDVVILEKEE
jgi:L-ascorbate metabolism protein UlaG (beta-lactamase superfamily)